MWPRDLCYVRYWRRNDDGSYGNLDDSLCGYSSVRETYLMLCVKLTVVLFRSTEHHNCGPQPGFVRAFIESMFVRNPTLLLLSSSPLFLFFLKLPTISGGGFKISPLKCLNRRPRTQVQHLMQIDLKGWGVNYFPSFQYHSLLQMLNCVPGTKYTQLFNL